MTFVADMENLSMRQMTYKPGNVHTIIYTWNCFE
jgi:hypothetical protein